MWTLGNDIREMAVRNILLCMQNKKQWPSDHKWREVVKQV